MKAISKSLGLLVMLTIVPYRIASGSSPNAIHTWIMSLFWRIHYDQVNATFHFTTQPILIIFFLMIAIPALYFQVTLQRRNNGFNKKPFVLSIFAPFFLDFLISIEDELDFPFTLSRYEWQSLYAFSLVILVTMCFIPLLLNILPKGMENKLNFRRPKCEAIVVAISFIVLPSVIIGIGRMFTHYTYDERVFYSPLWSALFWERSGAFYSASEFVIEFYRPLGLSISLLSFFFTFVFILMLFQNYGKMNSRTRILIIGIAGVLISTLSFYISSLMSSAMQRVYIFAFPIPISFSLGLLILKFSYPKFEISIEPEVLDTAVDSLQKAESEDVIEISIMYRFLSWLRKRL